MAFPDRLGPDARQSAASAGWQYFGAIRSDPGATREQKSLALGGLAGIDAAAAERSVLPASPIPAGSVVTVVLTPRFGELTITGCYRVTDLAPSGLEPLSWAWGGTHGSEDVTPWVISGQRVVFCASPGSARPPRLVYSARVVTPGEYAWEPAVMQAARGPESAALTAPGRIVIR